MEDSNIALLGSDLENRVREHAGDKEPAWEVAGSKPGIEIWRIEKFRVVPWPKDRTGDFYDGDSYVILHTYKKESDSEKLSYDIHFWLGEDTSQDEAGTAAYKSVELDDHFRGQAVQYREVQGYESARFLSYFPRFLCLNGGVSTGFHHVSSPPPLDLHRLYQICASTDQGPSLRTHIAIRQVPPQAASLNRGDAFVLDLGTKILQLNTSTSSGKEKFMAAEFVRVLLDGRGTHCELTVYDEGGSGAGIFLSSLGADALPPRANRTPENASTSVFHLSDASGLLKFEPISPLAFGSLSSSDAFLVDASSHASPAIYVWIGKSASLKERRLAIEYAQRYLHGKMENDNSVSPAVTIVKLQEGAESEAFLDALGR